MPQDQPLVSIITPAWKAARYIGETLASVRAQTLGDWEHLVIDDCSPDDTAQVVAAAAAGDPRLRLLRTPANGGPARARNVGLAEARGRYVCFLDADDLWHPEKLALQIETLTRRDAAICYTGYRRLSFDLDKRSRQIRVPRELTYSGLLRNTAIVTSSAMIDTARTGPLRMTEAARDDYLLWLGLLKAGHRAVGLNRDLVQYRRVPGSVSSKQLHASGIVWHIYRQHERLPLPFALWCFLNYAARAVWKRLPV